MFHSATQSAQARTARGTALPNRSGVIAALGSASSRTRSSTDGPVSTGWHPRCPTQHMASRCGTLRAKGSRSSAACGDARNSSTSARRASAGHCFAAASVTVAALGASTAARALAIARLEHSRPYLLPRFAPGPAPYFQNDAIASRSTTPGFGLADLADLAAVTRQARRGPRGLRPGP